MVTSKLLVEVAVDWREKPEVVEVVVVVASCGGGLSGSGNGSRGCMSSVGWGSK